jgi:polygalacturonase
MRGPQGAPVGTLRRVLISNLVSSNSQSRLACMITGIPGHPVEDVKLNNIYVQHQGGGTEEDAAIAPPEKETAYPEPNMFGPLPAHGFFVRHAKGIEMTNVEIEYAQSDARPALVFDDVQEVDILRLKVRPAAGAPIFALHRVDDFRVDLSRPVPDTHLEHVDKQKL